MARHEDMTTGHDGRATAGSGAACGVGSGPARSRFGRPARVAAAAAAVLAAGALLAGCGGKDDSALTSKAGGDPAPAGSSSHGDSDGQGRNGGSEGKNGGGIKSGGQGGEGEVEGGGTSGGSDPGSTSSGGAEGDATTVKGGNNSTTGGPGSTGRPSPSTQDGSGKADACTSADLTARIGPNHPGAGQENFALVLTNDTDAACTVRGYPGFAFLNADRDQVSVDPERDGGSAQTVQLAPGKSAWAPLSFSNPAMTGVPTVTPDSALLTPPDQRSSIRVDWRGGPVTATGKASVPKIGTLAPGTGD